MCEPELRQLLEPLREPCQGAAPLEAAKRPQLGPGRAARAHEIGVICVREPVRTRLRRADDGALREREDRAGGTRRGEQLGDRSGPLGVGERVIGALLDGEVDPFGMREAGQELCAGTAARA